MLNNNFQNCRYFLGWFPCVVFTQLFKKLQTISKKNQKCPSIPRNVLIIINKPFTLRKNTIKGNLISLAYAYHWRVLYLLEYWRGLHFLEYWRGLCFLEYWRGLHFLEYWRGLYFLEYWRGLCFLEYWRG